MIGALLTWRPSWWIAARRWLRLTDNALLSDNRRVAEHNLFEAHKRRVRIERLLRRAQEDEAMYERELRRTDVALRNNDRGARDDAVLLAVRASR